MKTRVSMLRPTVGSDLSTLRTESGHEISLSGLYDRKRACKRTLPKQK